MIVLVRHGQTEFNRDHRIQGRVDSPLTGLGVAQAEAVGRRLAALAAEGGDWRIETSPLGRARHTAEIIGGLMGLPAPRIEPRLIEVSYGAVEGLTREEADTRWPELANLDSLFGRAPEGESFGTLVGRVGAWLAAAKAAGGVCVAVSHAGVVRAARGLHLGLGEAAMRRLDKPQDAVFRLDGAGETRIDCPPLPTDAPGR